MPAIRAISVQRRGKFFVRIGQLCGISIRLALIACDVLRRRFNLAGFGVFLEQSVQIRICFGQCCAVSIDGLVVVTLQIVVRLFAPFNRFIEIGGVDLTNRDPDSPWLRSMFPAQNQPDPVLQRHYY